MIYIPLKDFPPLGTDENTFKQYGRLLDRIRGDAEAVQQARKESWRQFDAKQLSLVFDYAFKHLTSLSEKPFDFSDCRCQTDLPKAATTHVTEFLKSSLRVGKQSDFESASQYIGSCMVMKALEENGTGMSSYKPHVCSSSNHSNHVALFNHPDAVYNTTMKKMVVDAIEKYLDSGVSCNFVDGATGKRCINTKDGHSKGHQGADGSLLAAGGYEGGSFDSNHFQDLMMQNVQNFLRRLTEVEDDQRSETARQIHRELVPQASSWASTAFSKLSSSRTCFGCMFRAPEYRLPCDHFLCSYCLRIFDESTGSEAYPALMVH